MKNKFYTVFFASERNNYSRSFQVNKVSFMFLLFFGIMIVGFAFIGIIRFFNKDILSKELVFIRNKSYKITLRKI